MRSFIIIVLAVFVSACSVSVAPVTEYTLDINRSTGVVLKQSCNKSLKVQKAFAQNNLMQTKMYYGEGVYKRYPYSESVWLDAPNKMISDALAQKMQVAKLFTSVSTYKSRAKSDLLLEVNIEDFTQYFDVNETHSFARLSITLNLLVADTNRVIQSKTFQAQKKVNSLDAKGGVSALNVLLNDFLEKSVLWIEGVCDDK